MSKVLFCTVDQSGNVVQRDLDIEHAAHAILTYDGAKYRLRPAATRSGYSRPGLELWVSGRSGSLVKSIFWSNHEDPSDAWSDIARDVVRSGAFKLDARNQDAHDAEQAELAAQVAA